jgi:hypothetical protein
LTRSQVLPCNHPTTNAQITKVLEQQGIRGIGKGSSNRGREKRKGQTTPFVHPIHIGARLEGEDK